MLVQKNAWQRDTAQTYIRKVQRQIAVESDDPRDQLRNMVIRHHVQILRENKNDSTVQ